MFSSGSWISQQLAILSYKSLLFQVIEWHCTLYDLLSQNMKHFYLSYSLFLLSHQTQRWGYDVGPSDHLLKSSAYSEKHWFHPGCPHVYSYLHIGLLDLLCESRISNSDCDNLRWGELKKWWDEVESSLRADTFYIAWLSGRTSYERSRWTVCSFHGMLIREEDVTRYVEISLQVTHITLSLEKCCHLTSSIKPKIDLIHQCSNAAQCSTANLNRYILLSHRRKKLTNAFKILMRKLAVLQYWTQIKSHCPRHTSNGWILNCSDELGQYAYCHICRIWLLEWQKTNKVSLLISKKKTVIVTNIVSSEVPQRKMIPLQWKVDLTWSKNSW